MSRLTSTGVFFSAPAPVDDLPLLPGKLVEAVACPTPVMVGEFKHANGEAYVMIVNLSLERSAKFTLTTRQPCDVHQDCLSRGRLPVRLRSEERPVAHGRPGRAAGAGEMKRAGFGWRKCRPCEIVWYMGQQQSTGG